MRDTVEEFNPARLELARQRRGMTKTALAQNVGMTLRYLMYISDGKRLPSLDVISRFADVLGFPAEFFFGPELDMPPLEGASFRSFSSLSARMRDRVMAAARLGVSLTDWIERKFDVPQPDVPTFEVYDDPEVAATELRALWGLGERSIGNMIHLLEQHGVKVYSLAEDTRSVDAYSFWLNGVPYVFLNTMKSAERSRMDAAHELGHLVLHRNRPTQSHRDAEKEAQRFGSAFLMPRDSVISHVPRFASVEDLIDAKTYWGVSVSNLAYRMGKLGLTSENQKRWMFARIGQLGFRKNEPNPMEREKSAVLAQVFEFLKSQGQTIDDIAQDLCLHTNELGKLVWGNVPFFVVVEGHDGSEQDGDTPPKPTSYLRIV